MSAMEIFYLLLILVTASSSQQQVLADDDDDDSAENTTISRDISISTDTVISTDAIISIDDCKFAQSLKARPEVQRLSFIHKNYPRDDCVYWKIVASKSEIVEVQVAGVRTSLDVTCEQGYLKLFDDDNELVATSNKWSQNAKLLTKGSDLIIYFRSGHCLKDFSLNYRSVPKRGLTNNSRYDNSDEDDDDDADDVGDREESKSRTIGSIVGAVVGLVLAVLLIGLLILLVKKCVKQNRAGSRTVRDDSVTVHILSKPSGYIQPTEVAPTSAACVPETVRPQPGMSPKMLKFSGASDCNVYAHTRLLPPPGSTMSPPAPPPYPANENGLWRHPPTDETNEFTHLTEEPPPSYTDAVHTK